MRSVLKNTCVKLLVMDVDGTLTDGKIYIGAFGEIMKAFHVRDGYAITSILPALGIRPVIITGRQSEIVQRRAEELKIELVYQGVSDKEKKLRQIADNLHVSLCNIAYIGDDCNDLPCMKLVQSAGGITACTADAEDIVKQRCTYVCRALGGQGAVREFVSWLVGAQS